MRYDKICIYEGRSKSFEPGYLGQISVTAHLWSLVSVLRNFIIACLAILCDTVAGTFRYISYKEC